ncbi:MAG: SDR family NAD(P)-dependent oxidoreductase [Reyranellaceae bacterium]
MVEGNTVVVTGGAGGIGRSTVRRLLADGYRVFAIDSDPRALEALLGDLGGDGRLDGLCADVTSEPQVEAAIGRAAAGPGTLYGLVHVAGGAGPKRSREIEGFSLAEWLHVIDLNLTSAFLATRAVVPILRRRGGGRVVLFSSVIADGENGPLTTVTGRLPYATAKAALLGFTRQLAKDEAEAGITINALMPGLILGDQGTRIRDRFDRLTTDEKSLLLGGYPAGKPGSGDDIAAAVSYLLSHQAGFVSGIALPVDGAYR